MKEMMTKKDAIAYLSIPEKDFKNYFESSKEIIGEKIKNRWYFDKYLLNKYKELKIERTVLLDIEQYEKWPKIYSNVIISNE